MATEIVQPQPQASQSSDVVKGRLAALGITLGVSRSEAIDARKELGIESEWAEDEEFYESIDDANRHEYKGVASSWREKPAGQAGLVQGAITTGSTIFLNITRPFTDAATARVSDMLLPADGQTGWDIDATPLQDELDIAKGEMDESMKGDILEAMGGDMEKAQGEVDRITSETVNKLDEARAKAKKAKKRIKDWHIESQYNAEVRRVIDKSGQVGSAVLKGPFNKRVKKSKYVTDEEGVGQLKVIWEIIPISKCLNHWNFFPDPACGNDLHNGGFTWERDDITEKVLRGLKGTGAYINDQIDVVLSEDACEVNNKSPMDRDGGYGSSNTDNLTKRKKKGLYQIWYYYGRLKTEDMKAAGLPGADKLEDHDAIDVEVVMVNNHIIRAIKATSEAGDFPYSMMVWQKREGTPWGIGIARQLRPAQRIVNAATRAMMDNAGRASGPQLLIQQGVVEPLNDKWEILPWKIWLADEKSDSQTLDKAFRFVHIDMLQEQLQNIIMLGLKMAEDVTGLPMILQGQMGQTAPNTLGGLRLLQNNASSVLRRIARLFDDLITTPNIKMTYRWLLKFGKHDDEKGDLAIHAKGSSALVERDIQNAEIEKMGVLAQNPIYGIDPKKWAEEYLKSRKLDPEDFQFDDDKWKQIVKQMSQGRGDPRQAIAQMKTELDEKLATVKLAYETNRDEQDRELEVFKTLAMAELEKMKQEGVDKNVIEKIKGILADTSLKLSSSERMFAKRFADVSSVKSFTNRDAAEPPIRAENNEAATQ